MEDALAEARAEAAAACAAVVAGGGLDAAARIAELEAALKAAEADGAAAMDALAQRYQAPCIPFQGS